VQCQDLQQAGLQLLILAPRELSTTALQPQLLAHTPLTPRKHHHTRPPPIPDPPPPQLTSSRLLLSPLPHLSQEPRSTHPYHVKTLHVDATLPLPALGVPRKTRHILEHPNRVHGARDAGRGAAHSTVCRGWAQGTDSVDVSEYVLPSYDMNDVLEMWRYIWRCLGQLDMICQANSCVYTVPKGPRKIPPGYDDE
jgi:hypothetical protein